MDICQYLGYKTLEGTFKFSNLDYKSNYTGSVYIILKDGYTEFNGRYGVYVGQTSKSVEEDMKNIKVELDQEEV